MIRTLPLALAALLALPLTGCGSEQVAEAGAVPPPLASSTPAYDWAGRTELPEVEPFEREDLHNVFELSENILSGGEPLTDEALEAVAKMGAKTILSVDGKAPNVELAEKLGMRYVHVPIRYGGLSKAQMLQIAKTFRELPGPFYVHCFHGKHRGPAAAAVGRVLLDGASRELALAEMRQWCGTAAKYTGLYKSIANDALPTAKETEAYEWDFPSKHEITGLRAGMVDMTRTWDNVKWLKKNGWKSDAAHPDIDPVNETTKLFEQFEQMHALADTSKRPADYRKWMADSVTGVKELKTSVKAYIDGDEASRDLSDKKLAIVKDLCVRCHKPYRDK
ncbi:MAG: hypothetical protein QNJ98_00050 [Planctomycetota bacterium]|nr:hypothetical protein [Planctomycetota bacterium]